MMPCLRPALFCSLILCLVAPMHAEVGVVSHIKVVSDKVPDVSSLEAWARSTRKPGMSARDAREGWNYQVSFDGGKSFATVARAEGPHAGYGKYVSHDQIPAATRSALVRFDGQQVNTTGILDFRIDADYREPAGGFAPVRIPYAWSENGTEKTHPHTARSPAESYAIRCAGKPVMKSIAFERAD